MRKKTTADHQSDLDHLFGPGTLRVLGEYAGNTTPLLYEGVCGHTFRKRPNDQLYATASCQQCNDEARLQRATFTSKRHQADLDARFGVGVLKLIGAYSGALTNAAYACHCGDVRDRRPHDVLHSLYPCPNCARLRNVTDEARKSVRAFRRLAHTMTRAMYKRHHYLINPNGLEVGYELDHRYSIHNAFYNPKGLQKPISLTEVSHPFNLQMLTCAENNAKRHRSSISASELRLGIVAWNKRHGKPELKRNGYPV